MKEGRYAGALQKVLDTKFPFNGAFRPGDRTHAAVDFHRGTKRLALGLRSQCLWDPSAIMRFRLVSTGELAHEGLGNRRQEQSDTHEQPALLPKPVR